MKGYISLSYLDSMNKKTLLNQVLERSNKIRSLKNEKLPIEI